MFETEFLDAIHSHGFEPGDIIADGKYHRFDVRRGDKSGYYNLDANGEGVFGNWKTGEQFIFRSGTSQHMTEQQRAEARGRFKAEEKRRTIEKEQEQQRAAKIAQEIFEKAKPTDDHWYLTKKVVKSHDLKIDGNGDLLIPMYYRNEIANFQRITRERKLFQKGAHKTGCYFIIKGEEDVIYICEGYATAASVYEATGKMTVVAFDAGNILPVAKIFRHDFVDAVIVIAADNDQWTERDGKKTNVGLESAQKAAEAVYGQVIFPPFSVDDPDRGTDWNDYANKFGLDEVNKLLHVEVKNQEVIERKQSAVKIIDSNEYDFDENGKPRPTIDNLRLLAKRRNITLRYNVIRKQEEILIPGESYSIDNAQNAAYARILSFCKEEDMSTAPLGDYLTYLCDQKQYNPVTTWILHKPWDGRSRLNEFFATVETPDTLVKELILTRWMVSAVASAFSTNGLSTRGVLVFQGEQYLGKTSWFKKLVPSALDVRKDGYILRLDDKDNIFQCLSHWLIELGELEATFKKSDIAQLKAFIPMDRDILRRPYARKDSCYARRTVFFASVNQREFLFDETGNTRFWSIPTTKLHYDHDLDMQQVWAEFYNLYLDGEGYIMTADEMRTVNSNNEEFMGADYHEELVSRRMDWDMLALGGAWRTATELCAMLGVQNPKQHDLNRIGKAVRKCNGNKTKRGAQGVRLLWVPSDRRGIIED